MDRAQADDDCPPDVEACITVTAPREDFCPDGATCLPPGSIDHRPQDEHQIELLPGGGGGPSGDDGGDEDDGEEEEEVADESPGCWESLVDGETEVTSGFRPPHRPNHHGVDLRCPTGTNVYSAEAGKVTGIPNEDMVEGHKVRDGFGTGGNMIEVTYDSGRVGRYMHLLPRDRQGVMVEVDDEVSAGQLLGACNDTGNSDAPHLHYELKLNGTHVDPVQGHDCE